MTYRECTRGWTLVGRWCRVALALSPAMAFLSAAGCALYLDWEPDDALPCDERGECADGYSCLINVCVKDSLLELEETCTRDRQCAGHDDVDRPVVCGPEIFQCAYKCTDFFGRSPSCEAGQFCYPLRAREAGDRWVGVCANSECKTDEDCPIEEGTSCVKMTSDAGACLQTCDITFEQGEYRDRCPWTVDAPTFCQPVGLYGYRQPVCLPDLQDGGPTIGETCEPLTNPCRSGAACVNNYCRAYCPNDQTTCESGDVCCRAVDDDELPVEQYSTCSSDCL